MAVQDVAFQEALRRHRARTDPMQDPEVYAQILAETWGLESAAAYLRARDPPGLGAHLKEAGRSFAKGVASGVMAIPEAAGLAIEGAARFTGLGDEELTDNALVSLARATGRGMERLLPGDMRFEGSLTREVGAGAGSLVSSLASAGLGLAGRGAMLARGASGLAAGTVAITPSLVQGMAANGVSAFYQALSEGATDEQAFETFALASVIQGPLEIAGLETAVLRLGSALAKADRASGGLIRRSFTGALAQGAQEFTQGGVGEVLAQSVYDADREAWDMFLSAARQGVVGGIAAGPFASAVALVERHVQQQAMVEQAQAQATATADAERAARPISGESEGKARKAFLLAYGGPEALPPRIDLARAEGEEQTRIERLGAERGIEVLFAREGAGKELPVAGFFEDGLMVLDASASEPSQIRAVFVHEALHALKDRQEGTWEALYGDLAKLDPEGLQAAQDAYMASQGGQVAGAALVRPGVAREEGVSQYGQVLGLWVDRALSSPEEMARLARGEARGVLQKMLDALVGVLRRLGLNVKTSVERELAGLVQELGVAGDLSAQESAVMGARIARAVDGLKTATFAPSTKGEATGFVGRQMALPERSGETTGEIRTRTRREGALARLGTAAQTGSTIPLRSGLSPTLKARALETGFDAIVALRLASQYGLTDPGRATRAQRRAAVRWARKQAPGVTEAATVEREAKVGDYVRLPDGREGFVRDVTGSGVRRRVEVELPVGPEPDPDASLGLKKGGLLVRESLLQVVVVERPGSPTMREQRGQERAQLEQETGADPRFSAPHSRVQRILASVPARPASRRAARGIAAGPQPLDRQLVQALFDSMIEAKLAIDDYYAGGGTPLDPADDFYKRQALQNSAAADRIERALQPVRETVLEFTGAGGDYALIGESLYLDHADERDAWGSFIRGKNAEWSGLSMERRADIQNKLGALTQEQRTALDKAKGVLRAELERASEAKVVEGEMPDFRNHFYKNYVPLKTDMDTELDSGSYHPQGASVRSSGEVRALGRLSEADDPLLFSMLKIANDYVRVERAKTGRALLSFVQKKNDPGFARVGVPIAPKAVERTFGGQTLTTVEMGPDLTVFFDEGTVVVPRAGKFVPVAFQGNNVRLARAIKNMNAAPLQGYEQAFRKATWLMTSLLTRWNPVFPFPNAVRDFMGSRLLAKQWGISGWQIAKRLPSSWARLRVGLADRSKADAGVARYLASGARVTTLGVRDLDSAWAELHKDMRSNAPWRQVRALGSWVEILNDVAENGTRLAVFEALLEHGVPEAEAAFRAKELINFERKGDWNGRLGAYWAFFNANMQGTRVVTQALGSSKIRRALLRSAALLTLLDVLNRMVAGDDENGANRYDKIPDSMKERYLILMSPLGDGDFLSIPLPPGFSAFFYAGTIAGEMLSGRTNALEAGGKIAKGVVSSFNPWGDVPNEGGASGLIQLATPTILDPVVDVILERRYTGAPLMPARWPGDVSTPDAERFFSGSEGSVTLDLARALNRITDADDSGRGAIDVSPESIGHLLEGYMGGVGRLLTQASAVLGKAVGGEEMEARDVPVLSRFYRNENPYYTSATFYANRERIEQATRRYKTLLKEDRERAAGWYERNKVDIRHKRTLDAHARRAKDLRDDGEDEKARKVMAEFNAKLDAARAAR